MRTDNDPNPYGWTVAIAVVLGASLLCYGIIGVIIYLCLGV